MISVASTLRGRLILLLMAAIVPMAALSVFLYVESRARALLELERNLGQLMTSAISEQDNLVEYTRRILSMIARANDVRRLDDGECSALAARLLETQPVFINFGAADTKGNIVCSARSFTANINVADRAWFRLALAGNAMTEGEYQVGRITDKPIVVFAMPLFNGDRTRRGVLFASADMRWLQSTLKRIQLPQGWRAGAVHMDGQILAHRPGGEPLWPEAGRPDRLLDAMRMQPAGGSIEIESEDGARVRYDFAPLSAAGNKIFVVLGGDTQSVVAPLEREFYLQIGLIAVVIALSFLASWLGIDASILRWSHATRNAAARFGRGELNVRFGNGSGVAELSEISHAFNRMADEMAARETRRREAEQALRESELKFRAIFQQTFELVALLDTAGTLVEINDVALDFGGAKREDVVGKKLWDTFWWAEDEVSRGRLRKAIEQVVRGDSVAFEVTHAEREGKRVIECRLRPIKDESGRVVWEVAEGRDVTEKKRADEQLRLSATVFEDSRDAICITDGDERILTVNRSFCKTTGYTPEEVIGKKPGILKSGRQDGTFYDAMWRSIQSTGSWRGEIWNRRKGGEIYPAWLSITAVRDAKGAIGHYIGIATDITEHKQAEERIRYLAYHDALTGLPNRALLSERAGQALTMAERDGEEMAVLFVDLDHFKTINDSLGYGAGDGVLQALSKRLRTILRETDTLARTGGDEFVIVLAETGAEGAAHVARKLLALVEDAYTVGDNALTVGMSIGISIYPADARDFDSLMQHADAAMFRAKSTGRNGYQFYKPEMNAAAHERLRLENDLRRALHFGEFVLHYQPQVSVKSGAIVGMEALLRWNDPQTGMMPPGKFIPVAEDSGLIVPIGEWVLREACRQAKQWQAEGLPAVPIAVNLSASQFRQGGIADSVDRALREAQLDPRWLELELTESMVMEDSERTLETLNRLKALGVSLSIDDFGTGYSSLSYLKRFPIDKLKIDRSFVQDITADADDLAIATAVISIGHSLRLKVIAEGVETGQQLAILAANGCDEAQGYHFSRPVPADEMARQLRTSPAEAPTN